MSNARRIDNGRFIVRAFAAMTEAHTLHGIDPESFVDCITDVLHYHAHIGQPDGRSAEQLVAMALEHFTAETEGES